MHIGIDIRSLLDTNQTGVGTVVSGMVKALLSHKEYTVTLYYNAAKKVSFDETPWKKLGANIVRTRYPNKLMTLCSPFLRYPRVDRIIAKQVGPIDVFFSPNIQYIPLTKKVPRILLIHDLSFVHFPEFFSKKRMFWHGLQRIEKQIREATHIIVPSESTRDDVIGTYCAAKEKISVVHPGIDTWYFDEVSEAQIQEIKRIYNLPEKFVFFLGTIEPRKNLVMMIESFELSKRIEQGFELIIAGAKGWNARAIYEAIANTPGVRYIGYVKEHEKPALYQAASTFVYPSLYEGFGFPVLEAMAQGTPVITSNRTSLPEITNGKVTLVHPEHVHELVHAIQAVHTTEKNEAYKVIAGEYTWDKTAKQLQTLFDTYGK